MSARQQSMFDKVLFHLRKQGKASIKGATCQYRGPNNTKCAAGILIRQSEYSPKMEGKAITSLSADNLLPKRLKRNLRLIEEMQDAHDTASWVPSKFVERFNENMQEVARKYHLRYTPPQS